MREFAYGVKVRLKTLIDDTTSIPQITLRVRHEGLERDSLGSSLPSPMLKFLVQLCQRNIHSSREA